MIKSITKKTSSANKIKFSLSSEKNITLQDSSYYVIELKTDKFGTAYPQFIKNKFLGEKTIERKLSGKIDVLIRNGRDNSYRNEVIAVNYKDEIPFDNYKSYENSDFLFTLGKPLEINYFERIIFPALLITASAGAILAFFVIRTK